MTEKEAILRDLRVIAILDDKIDYSDHDNIGAVLKLNPKSLFSTEYGERYLERVRQMYDGDDYEHTCILCGEPLDGDGPVCGKCYRMITTGNAKKPQMPEPIHTEITEEEPVETHVEEKSEEPQAEETVAEPEEAPAEETVEESEEAPAEETVEEPEEAPVDEPAEPTVEESDTEPEEPPKPEDVIAEHEEEEKREDEGSDDLADIQKTYSEMEQEAMDPKARRLYVWRAVIMLFVVACFAIGIVCGLVLMIRSAGGRTNTYYNKRIEYDIDTDTGELDC